MTAFDPKRTFPTAPIFAKARLRLSSGTSRLASNTRCFTEVYQPRLSRILETIFCTKLSFHCIDDSAAGCLIAAVNENKQKRHQSRYGNHKNIPKGDNVCAIEAVAAK